MTEVKGNDIHPGGQSEEERRLAAEREALRHAPIDPVNDAFPWPLLNARLMAVRRPLRELLQDPAFLVGITGPLADEILWASGLRHDRRSDALSAQEVRRLYRALRELPAQATLPGATAASSSSDNDDDEDAETPEVEPEPAGRPGRSRAANAQPQGVHGRAGQPCPRCRTTLIHVELPGGDATDTCPKCQS
jgi:formamidopyrimidine-DNA glycosylase